MALGRRREGKAFREDYLHPVLAPRSCPNRMGVAKQVSGIVVRVCSSSAELIHPSFADFFHICFFLSV